MSFSSQAKAELCQLRADKKSIALAECYGALLYCHTFSAREIRLITGSRDFAQRLPKLFKRAFGFEFDSCSAPEKSSVCMSCILRSPEEIPIIIST